jgi:DNA-binding transcriptional ArsR family regulator
LRSITDINDPRLVKALAHPVRIQILSSLEDRVASPSRLSEELEVPLGTVSYHVRILAELGLIELVDRKQRRGAIEHYYRARGPARISEDAWEEVPNIVKEALVQASLGEIYRYVDEAAAGGGFSRGDSQLVRQPLTLDARGWKELTEAISELCERAKKIEADSASRLHADRRRRAYEAALVLMYFERPAAGQREPDAERTPGRAGAATSRRPLTEHHRVIT